MKEVVGPGLEPVGNKETKKLSEVAIKVLLSHADWLSVQVNRYKISHPEKTERLLKKLEATVQMAEDIKSGLVESEVIAKIAERAPLKIGLSLSFCIKNIMQGEVREEEVGEIIAGTKAEKPEDWPAIIKSYRESYWYKYPEEAEALFWRLLAAGKIRQPRVEKDDWSGHNIVKGHWITADQLAAWEEKQEKRRRGGIGGEWSDDDDNPDF